MVGLNLDFWDSRIAMITENYKIKVIFES